MAQAALEADAALGSLRYRLVPARLSEEEFWRCYFWRVANIKCELCNDFATANALRRQATLADDALLADEAEAASPAGGSRGGDAVGGGGSALGLDEDALDDEFERLVGSPL